MCVNGDADIGVERSAKQAARLRQVQLVVRVAVEGFRAAEVVARRGAVEAIFETTAQRGRLGRLAVIAGRRTAAGKIAFVEPIATGERQPLRGVEARLGTESREGLIVEISSTGRGIVDPARQLLAGPRDSHCEHAGHDRRVERPLDAAIGAAVLGARDIGRALGLPFV